MKWGINQINSNFKQLSFILHIDLIISPQDGDDAVVSAAMEAEDDPGRPGGVELARCYIRGGRDTHHSLCVSVGVHVGLGPRWASAGEWYQPYWSGLDIHSAWDRARVKVRVRLEREGGFIIPPSISGVANSLAANELATKSLIFSTVSQSHITLWPAKTHKNT